MHEETVPRDRVLEASTPYALYCGAGTPPICWAVHPGVGFLQASAAEEGVERWIFLLLLDVILLPYVL